MRLYLEFLHHMPPGHECAGLENNARCNLACNIFFAKPH
jgi:hypothetical protein